MWPNEIAAQSNIEVLNLPNLEEFTMNSRTRFSLAVAILSIVIIIAAIPIPRSVRAGGPWYVAPGGSDGNDCLSAVTTCATINGALGKPGFIAGDIVLVATGTYTGTGTEVVSLNISTTLSGGWDSGFTAQNGMSTIDGESARRGLTVNSGVLAIATRFAIQHNEVAGYIGNGDGILNVGTLTLNQVHVHANAKVDGGGGIINQSTGILTINNSAVTDNGSINGCDGGIFNAGGSLNINNSTVSGNASSTIYCAPIAGIANQNGSLSLNNVTIANNTGGGLWSYPAGTTTLRNTIIAGNTVNGSFYDCNTGDVLNSLGYNIIGAMTCTITSTVGDQFGSSGLPIDPKLSPLKSSPAYHPLSLGSPAIDAGNPAGCKDNLGNLLLTDERGALRLGRCDIGAIEYQALDSSSKSVNVVTAAPGSSVKYTILLSNTSVNDLANVIVTDTLPSLLKYNASSLSATVGSYDYSSGVITWTGSMNAGETVTIGFETTISQTAPLGDSILNSTLINGDGAVSIATATFSIDGQPCNLTKYAGNPVLSVGANGSWDDAAIWRPTVLKDGSTYKMWYSGYDGATRRIGYAASTDGIHWTKYGSNPVLTPGSSGAWDDFGVYAPSVIYDGVVYKMWYRGRNSGGVNRIGYATSTDGIAWTKYGAVLNLGSPGSWDAVDVTEPTVIKVGSTYHMWYVGYDGITLRIGHATSSDGITWIKDVANPVLNLGASGNWDWLDVYGPSIVKVGNEFRLWYSGDTLPSAYQTGYATSLDGITWTRQQKLISEGPLNAFDVYSADYPAVIVDGAGYKVWYSGINSSGTYNIGYATAGACSANLPSAITTHIYLPLITKGESCAAYYIDNFSNPNSGWPISDDSNRRYAYTNGEYQILVKNAYHGWYVTPGAKATDFTASVSARRMSGTLGAYGILFGINEDWSQLYEVLIDANSYSIWLYDQYNYGWTALKNWTSSSYIATGTSRNRLKVVRNGSSISVYVNNHLLTTLVNGSFTGLRRIGFAAESDDVGADIRFDDFSMYPASCGVTAYTAASNTPQFEMGKPEIHTLPEAPRLPQP